MRRDFWPPQRCAAYPGAQDTLYVGTLKGVGRIYQQIYIDTYAKTAQAKLYTTETPITAADMLNDKVLPFHEQHDLPVLRILTPALEIVQDGMIIFHGTKEDWAKEALEESGFFHGVPDHIRTDFDTAKWIHDCECEGSLREFRFAGETWCANPKAY